MSGAGFAMVYVLAMTVAAPSGPETRAEAKRLFSAGAAAYDAGQYLAAAQALEQAYQLTPLPAIAFSLAQAYRLQYFVDQDSRHLDRAIALYHVYIEATPRGGRRTDAVSSLADLEPIKSRFEQERQGPLAVDDPTDAYEPPTQLMIVCDAPGATAALDGGAPTAVPLVAEVKAGSHEAKVSADGYFAQTRKVVAVEGRLVVADVDLEERPARVELTGLSSGSVWVDGKQVGSLPLAAPVEMNSGRHRLTVTRAGRRAWARDITVKRGAEVSLEPEFELTVQREVSYYVIGAGAATLTAATVMGSLALADDQNALLLLDKRDVEGLTVTERSEYEDLAIRRDSRATLAWALFGVGAAVGVAGSLLYVLDAPGPVRPPDSGVLFGIVPSAGGGAYGYASLSGRW